MISFIYSLPFAQDAGLRCCSPASGPSRCADGRRTSDGCRWVQRKWCKGRAKHAKSDGEVLRTLRNLRGLCVLREQTLKVAAMLAVVFGECLSAFGETDAHRTVTYHFAVTNTTDKAQTVESVRTSCACLKTMQNAQCTMHNEGDAIPPGGVWPFEVVFDPAGMEGPVQKRVWVTLAPSKKIESFDISENVRLRLGFKPMDAAFGVIKRSETGREITAQLAGYVADDVTLGTPAVQRKGNEHTDLFAANAAHDPANAVRREQIRLLSHPGNPANPVEESSVFDVRLSPDGKSVVAKFRDRDLLPGIYAETWTIPTSDAEIPEIKFSVSARVADALFVTPQVITVGWDEPVCSRMVMVRETMESRHLGGGAGGAAGTAAFQGVRILSAETKPRKWGDVTITQRRMNGWRIDIANIAPREVRQFSKRPFLEVKTDLPGMETFEIPLRIINEGDMK